jgi:hypothetical protein
MNTNTNSHINTDVLSEIISFLNITEDKQVLTSCRQLFNLTDNENNQILRTWENNSKYECKENKNKTEWYVNGKLHREADLPAIEWTDGTKHWYINGKRHREVDRPAVEWSADYKSWWVDGKRHRDNNKPAVEYADGSKEWWVNGEFIRSA